MRVWRPRAGRWGLILIVMLAFAAEASAQIKQERKLPQLAGYNLLPAMTVPDPFITTYIRSATGFGVALDITIPVYDRDGNVVDTLDGDLAFLLLGFEYQQALTRWLSLRLGVEGLARVGVNAESVLAQGISAVRAFDLGATIRLWHNRNAILSLVGSVRNSRLIGVDIIGFVQKVIKDDGIADKSDLLRKQSALSYSGGVRFGLGLGKGFGLTLLAEGGSAESIAVEGGREGTYTFAGTVSFDINAVMPLPVGLLFGYTQSNFPVSGDDIAKSVRTWVAKVAYTGREEFSVGAEFNFFQAPLVRSPDTLEAASAFLTLRYFF